MVNLGLLTVKSLSLEIFRHIMLLPSGRCLGREEVTLPSTSEFPSGELCSPKFGAPLGWPHNQGTVNLCFVRSSRQRIDLSKPET